MKFYNDKDVSLSILHGKKIAVIGFGSQGSAQAMCMKDSKLDVVVGLRQSSKSAQAAKDYGLEVASVSEAVKSADIVHMLLPDQVQANVYIKEIAPHMNPSKALSFSHGFNIVFGLIKPPKNVDVFMLAPHSPGPEQRRLFLEGKGVPGLVAIHQNKSGNAQKYALAMSKACGFTRVGVYECTFKQETYSDLFAEQSVLCGGLSELIKAGFDTLVKKGYPPEMAYFACLYEVRLMANLIDQHGIEGMFQKVSDTAEYGARTRGPKLIDKGVRKRMDALYSDVQSGKFAREWMKEVKSGLKNLEKMRRSGAHGKIEGAKRSVKTLLGSK